MAITPYHTPTDPFERFVDAFLAPVSAGRTHGPSLMRGPATDVMETENEIRVMIEMAGMRPDDIELGLENNILTISGEKREHRDQGGENATWHISERRYGQFSRSFLLPRDVEHDRIEASFDNGVLTVSIPKSERARRRRIEIRGPNGPQRVEASNRENAHESDGGGNNGR
jgi:HSP20 family protein